MERKPPLRILPAPRRGEGPLSHLGAHAVRERQPVADDLLHLHLRELPHLLAPLKRRFHPVQPVALLQLARDGLAAVVVVPLVHELAVSLHAAADDVHVLVLGVVVADHDVLAFLVAHAVHELVGQLRKPPVVQVLAGLEAQRVVHHGVGNVGAELAHVPELSRQFFRVLAEHVPADDVRLILV